MYSIVGELTDATKTIQIQTNDLTKAGLADAQDAVIMVYYTDYPDVASTQEFYF